MVRRYGVEMPITAGTTIGVVGRPRRAVVTPWGAVTEFDELGRAGPTLEWYVAADDRWHVPARESSTRQRRLHGTPVVETRVRVPDGDVVHRVWAIPDHGGLTLLEIENESPLPVAAALSGAPVVTQRAAAEVPVQGIELPAGAVVLPIGHRATVRLALERQPAPASRIDLTTLPGSSDVTRGWQSTVGRASRLDLPDPALVEAVTAARCDLGLNGPVDPVDDPVGFVLDVGELVRLGEPAAEWLVELVEPIARIARRPGAEVDAAVRTLERIARAAGDGRAVGDAARLRRRRAGSAGQERPGPFAAVDRSPSAGRFVWEVERRLADDGDLLPAGLPNSWLGANFEVHGVPLAVDAAVSYAVRWHGDRPAVLWECTGAPVRLTARAVDERWASDEPSGEALWPARQAARRLAVRAE